MTRQIQVQGGEIFYEPHDWVAFMRDALILSSGTPRFGLDERYDYMAADRMVPMLFEAIKHSPMARAMADATLQLIEHGSPAETHAARIGPLAHAPDAYRRIEAILTSNRRLVLDQPTITNLLEALLFLKPEDEPTISRALAEDATRDDDYLLSLIAQHSPNWLATHLPPLSAKIEPYAWVAPFVRGRDAILRAIAAAGPDYIAKTIAPILEPGPTPKGRLHMADEFKGHPEFERAIANGLAKLAR